MKKSIIAAGAASVALAAMPVVGVFAADPFSDTIEVTVNASCTFTDGGAGVTYTASGANNAGTVSPVNNSSNEHSFTVFCNNNGGYNVTAQASALTQTGVDANFAYVATLPSGTTGAWTALISQAEGGSLNLEQLPSGGASTKIVSHTGASVTGGETFKAAYSAYIGTATPAGTYSGTIQYTLATGA